MVASIDMAETNYIFYGGCESINSLHSNISIYILSIYIFFGTDKGNLFNNQSFRS